MHISYYFTNICYNLSLNTKKIFFLLLTTFLSLGNLYAQLFTNYSTVRNTSVTYNSIVSTGTSVPNWRNTGTYSQDDNRSYFIPIGFDFWYNGVDIRNSLFPPMVLLISLLVPMMVARQAM